MSVVLVSAMENFIIFMSDGKVTHTEDGVIKTSEENYKKLRRINNNICVGYTGRKDACENVLTALDSCDKEKLDLTKAIDILHNSAKEIYKEKRYQNSNISMVVGGKSNEGNIEFFTFGSKYNFQLDSYITQGTKVTYTVLCPDKVEGSDILVKHLNLNLNESLNPLEGCQNAMRDCVDEIANSDETVNKNKFTEIIVTDI